MSEMRKYNRHYKKSVVVNAEPKAVFAYADDHGNFSSHMNKGSFMMAGSAMETEIDERKGKQVGSHIRMKGKVMGVPLSLDEVIVERDPPHHKAWETVGKVNLLVIDHYKLGFDIKSLNGKSEVTIFINYNLPQSNKARLLGYFFSGIYAKWCVSQMINGILNHFNN